MKPKAERQGGGTCPAKPLPTRRAYVEAFNSADWEQFEAALTTDSVYDEVGTGRRAEGREQRQRCAGVDLERNDDRPVGGYAPTGKEQTSRAAMCMSFSGEAISECRQYFDSLALLQQLGMMPEPAAV
jgi:hypothetical protein